MSCEQRKLGLGEKGRGGKEGRMRGKREEPKGEMRRKEK